MMMPCGSPGSPAAALEMLAHVAATPVALEPATLPCCCKPPDNQLNLWLELRGGRFWCTKCERWVVRVVRIEETKKLDGLQQHEAQMLNTIYCSDRKQTGNKKINHLAIRFHCAHEKHAAEAEAGDPFAALHFTKRMQGRATDHRRLRIWCKAKTGCFGASQGCKCLRSCEHGRRPSECDVCKLTCRKSSQAGQVPAALGPTHVYPPLGARP